MLKNTIVYAQFQIMCRHFETMCFNFGKSRLTVSFRIVLPRELACLRYRSWSKSISSKLHGQDDDQGQRTSLRLLYGLYQWVTKRCYRFGLTNNALMRWIRETETE
jgi:hypothetical protein